jgi:hypothetical protein
MPNGQPIPRRDPADRLREAADMLDTLAGLVGQANDIDVCGRDGLVGLLDLLAERVEQATRDLFPEPAR